VCIALVAAQAHSRKEDRAVVISARNFIRALGGSAGLATASAIYSNTLVRHLPTEIPSELARKIRSSIFDAPDTSTLSAALEASVMEAYVAASRSVFYIWVGAMGCCLLLTFLIKDKGLVRTEEEVVVDSGLKTPSSHSMPDCEEKKAIEPEVRNG
jgi:hypothetical protein